MGSLILETSVVEGNTSVENGKTVKPTSEDNEKIADEIEDINTSDDKRNDLITNAGGTSQPLNHLVEYRIPDKSSNVTITDSGALHEDKTSRPVRKGKRRSVSFAVTARMKTDSYSGEIKLNDSFNEGINNNLSSKNSNTSEQLSSETDMHMTIGLSVIPREDENLPFSPSCDKKISHSTPLPKNQKCSNPEPEIVRGEEKGQDNIFVCPLAPVNNLRRSASNAAECLKSYEKEEKSNLNKISVGNPVKRKSSSYSNTRFSDMEPIQYSDKVIQVSKTISGSTSEGTSFTSTRKRSSELSTSYSFQEDLNAAKKRTSNEYPSTKSLKVIGQSIGNKSYYSNSVSTLDTKSNHVVSNTRKRVAFKGIRASANSSNEYRSSTSNSNYYITRNWKSVGFREKVSLIDNSNDTFSANESNLKSISNKQEDDSTSIRSSKSSDVILVERNDNSVLHPAQVAEVILTENEESNDASRECSLYMNIVHHAIEYKENHIREKKKRKKFLKSQNLCKDSKAFVSDESSEPGSEKWVSSKLVKFLKEKLMNDNLDHVLKTERVISILCSSVNAVKNLNNTNDIDLTLARLKDTLMNFGICSNLIEYYSFIMRFTLFEFQKKVVPFGGYFGGMTTCEKKLTDPLLSESEKVKLDRINQLYITNKK